MSVVFNFKDEELVGLVVDRKTAAKLLWLCGEVTATDKDTTQIFDGLNEIREVQVIYDDELFGKVTGGASTVAITFPEVE